MKRRVLERVVGENELEVEEDICRLEDEQGSVNPCRCLFTSAATPAPLVSAVINMRK